jgi:hypothetical protein
MTKDTRPSEYMITEKRTIEQLSKEELEIVVCDFIDQWQSLAEEFNERFDACNQLLNDNILKNELPETK